ncbi:hypothetical protein ATPR_0066 [Acetobacter tropicalis NBRC 101654]|uniref:Uncharacterized protein n=1 Tax=Acetobacter tropicalis NBRC 101654 TaxID=749388 RepID=F7V9L8_9PROT|nr:hypothetical protein ATPR_0066 [Acetobacter tropicalis NBRC 101654]
MRREKGRGDQLPFFPRLGCLGVKATCREQTERAPSGQKQAFEPCFMSWPAAFTAPMGF